MMILCEFYVTFFGIIVEFAPNPVKYQFKK